MTARQYSTPLAFKQALEQRLRASTTTGIAFARRRQSGLGADGCLGLALGLIEAERLLDRRHRSFSGVLELLGSIHRCRLATLLNMGAYGDLRRPMPPLAG